MSQETPINVLVASAARSQHSHSNVGEATRGLVPIDPCFCPASPRLLLDRGRYAVKVDQETVPLTRTEFDLLDYLLAQSHRVVSPSEVMQAVLGSIYRSDSSVVRVHISHLRRKLGTVGQLIQTVRGRGFRIDAAALGSAAQPCFAVVGTGEHQV